MKDQLIADGYDVVVITAVIGVDDRQKFHSRGYMYLGVICRTVLPLTII